jgi:hypothetical protein
MTPYSHLLLVHLIGDALAAALAGECPAPRLVLKALLYLPRQILFIAIVLTHGLMRPFHALKPKARPQP